MSFQTSYRTGDFSRHVSPNMATKVACTVFYPNVRIFNKTKNKIHLF